MTFNHYAYSLAAIVYILFLLYLGFTYKKDTITKTSIKEGIDNLPAGLCFATEKGVLLLSNRTMESLCYTLTGLDLQDAVYFWDILTDGELIGGGKRLSVGKEPIIRLSDGRTWSFTRSSINVKGHSVIQITCTDSTDLDAMRVGLEENNYELARMGRRLWHYGRDLAEVKAGEERLATKVRLHDELGYTMLATRHLLGQSLTEAELEAEAAEILVRWKRNVAVLRGTAEMEKPAALNSLRSAAEAIGIKLNVQGNLPEDEQASDLILQIAGECLSNSARHARATELYLNIDETDAEATAVFYDNGIPPEKPVVEGGGLSALRHKVEKSKGLMYVGTEQFNPVVFIVKVSIPKKEINK